MSPEPGVVFQLGRRVARVTASHPDDLDAVRAVLAGFTPSTSTDAPLDVRCAVSRTPDGLWQVITEGVETAHQASTLEGALLAVEWQLVTDTLDHQSDRFHLHGAALVDPTDTMTVLVLGESGVGKTTLTLALIAAGYRPYADDVVLIDPKTLTAERFPRAFHVDATTRQLVTPLFDDRAWEVPGSPEGYCVPTAWASVPRPVGAIVFPKAHDHAHPLLIGLSIAEAAMTLLSFSTTLEQAPALALKTAARLTAVAPAFALWGGALAVNTELVTSAVTNILSRRQPREQNG